uniref:Venom redulysin 6 n=1 Tax=Platymeris rhadamanthus TaxID=1134088 RepID=A0A6B9KZ74_PLARH|nr:venom redulysin 6 [Platymeris rhadamanthus]
MSKIWLLLLLVGAIQLAQSFPALEEEELDDEYLLDLSDEERGFGDWAQGVWNDAKNVFKKLKKAIKQKCKEGREYLKNKGFKVEPVICEGGKKCKSCIFLPSMKKKFCLELTFYQENKIKFIKVACIRERDDKEPKEVFPPMNIALGKPSTCIKLGSILGKLCLQGVEGKAKSSKGQANINFCLAFVLKNFGVGAKLCGSYEQGKMNFKIKPKIFAGDDDDGAIIEGSETKEDEGKMVDAEVE